MKRRDFLKYSLGGMAAVVVGTRIPWINGAYAQAGQVLQVTITDAVKEMATFNTGLIADGTRVSPGNPAECYFWVYKMNVNGADLQVDCPGPIIVTTVGDTVTLDITNELAEDHAFSIPGILNSVTIPAGQTVTGVSFTPTTAGAYLYYDDLNEPVNRMMGLHGALIVRSANNYPYDTPTPAVKKLFDSFGSSSHYPGLAWHEGDLTTGVPPRREYVWLTHQASPKLFAAVGNNETITFTTNSGEVVTGSARDPIVFTKAFLHDKFNPVHDPFNLQSSNYVPQYFTINGQSGHFSHNNAFITPMGRVGEPVVIHILNAGLWVHAMHLHANHFYVTSINGEVSQNPFWLDTFNIHPMERVDYTVPFMRPPDVPNISGIGFPDIPLVSPVTGQPVWPPVGEFEMFFPGPGEDVARDAFGTNIDLEQRQSPLIYPMHDHSEPSQTSQGGNYNCGLIAGMNFIGDRNTLMDFPMEPDFEMMYKPGGVPIRGISSTGPAAPAPVPEV